MDGSIEPNRQQIDSSCIDENAVSSDPDRSDDIHSDTGIAESEGGDLRSYDHNETKTDSDVSCSSCDENSQSSARDKVKRVMTE